jgi:hypothetical protein
MNLGDTISLISISLVIIGLYVGIRQYKLSQTLEFIKRYNSPEFVNVKSTVIEWAESKKNNEEKIKMISEDKELLAKVTIYINLFTELGIAVKKNIVNVPVTYDLWYPAIPRNWDRLEFYIMHQRDKGFEIGVNFEKLVESLKVYKKRRFIRILYKLRLGL